MLKRQAAFEKKGTFLKGNLHTHTNLSDGLATPEATAIHYRNAGYDFLAITDHQRYYKPENTDMDGLLIIPAMEADRFVDGKGMPVVHVVALGNETGNGYTDGQSVLYERGGTQEACQDIIDDIVNANNLPMLCHPMWSGNTVEAVKTLHDFEMIEVWNTGSALLFDAGGDAYHWDVLLHEGRKVWAVATDDTHTLQDACFGWVMVNAEKNVTSILEALKNGEFYATCGPEIYDFYIENGYVHISCSPCSKIILKNFSCPHRVIRGENMTGGQIKLRDLCTDYIRAEVVDAQGRRAWTNPIFL
jgi:hypothetical protein